MPPNRSGASIEQVSTAITKMQKIIGDALLDPSGQAADQIKLLGLSLDDLKNKTPEERLALVVNALKQFSGNSEEAARWMGIFGKSGNEVKETLSTLIPLGEQLQGMGAIISDDNLKAAEDFKDSITDLNYAIQGMVNESGLITWLAEILTTMGEIAKAKKLIASGEVKTRMVQKGTRIQLMAGTGQIMQVPNMVEEIYTDAVTQSDIQTQKTKNKASDEKKTSNESLKQAQAKAAAEISGEKEAEAAKKKEEAQAKATAALEYENEVLKAKATLEDEALAKKLIELEYAKKIMEAETSKQKAILESNRLLELQTVDKEASNKLDKESRGIRTGGEINADRWAQIGGTVGMGREVELKRLDEERNKILKQIADSNKAMLNQARTNIIGGLA